MVVKVPKVNRCCFWFPLRPGIILFAYINIIFSVVSVTCLVITTELQKQTIIQDASVEMAMATVLFSILGMGIILNFLLLVAGYQKDISMLRLYNYYAIPTMSAALVPTAILITRSLFKEVVFALFAIAMQAYVIILVRSEVIKLEESTAVAEEERPEDVQERIGIPDNVTLV